MGKPVICTDMWTFRSVMGESRCAVYVREDSPQLIAEAILHCYRNRDRLADWGAEGRQVAEKGYSWAWQASVLTGFIGKLARERGPRRRR
jgi:glycosyltransferase involved in cell wall biosynthesis